MSEPTPFGGDLDAALRSLSRRLRREKLALERLNPVEQPDRYAAALTGVVDLEAERRDLRARLAGADDASRGVDDPSL